MSQTLTIFTLAYNLEKIKYPWRASIGSALYFADEVIVAECFSTDGTYEGLLEIQKQNPKLKIIRHPWGTDCHIQKTLAELCCKEATCDWIFYLNADEVIHHDSVFPLVSLKNRDIPYARAKYTHFLGNFETTWPFIYERVIRLANGKYTWSNDACEIECDHSKAEDLNTVSIHHYGKVSVGRSKEAGIKEQEFQQLYTAYGFPDRPLMELIEKHGRLDYADMMKARWKENNMRDESIPFNGTHPSFIKEWMEQMKIAHKESGLFVDDWLSKKNS